MTGQISFWRSVREDISAAARRDPAARSKLEIVLTYSGLHAVWTYRLSSRLWRSGWGRLPARILSQVARTLTGVEIHPAATIGRRLFIDHGMGVVIGATAIVGDDCHFYHGVTLGGTSQNRGKRHPTIGNRVLIGAGAKVLGDIRLGDESRVGANAVVVADVPPGITVVGVPARATFSKFEPEYVL